MPNTMVVVRPKATPLPRIEEWEVLREDPETGDVEKFRIECAEGHFYTFYRNQGLIDGTEPYDPYLDLDEGRLKRKRIAVYR